MNFLRLSETIHFQRPEEEFESRAMLYHILMDLEEFLVFKRRFVDGLDDKKRKLYWDN